MRPHAHLLATAATLAVLAGCATKPQVSAQQESGIYLSRAGRSYTPPGPAGDPWGPYVTEASAKYDVPQRWIREVMRQESGGRLYSRSGAPITSSAGAMGLMQVMPGTYDELRVRYPELGDDPFDPHNNIMAGTAYIREMYDIYGAPGFLAAYNAGPGRPRRWREGPVLEAAAWVENIPFAETRDYVKKVLSNATYYASVLGGKGLSIRSRLGRTMGPPDPNAPPPEKDLP